MYQPKRKVLALAAAVAVLLLGSMLPAQEFQLRIQQPPYYVGEPVVIQVAAKGFDGSAEPSCKLVGSLANGIRVTGPEMRQDLSRFMQFSFGGQTTTRETVNYTFQFLATASAAGEYDIGPFEVEYGGQKKIVDGTTFSFKALAEDPDMQVHLAIPAETLYVGQRVPVTISWAMAGEFYEIEYAFRNLQIRSPIFDQFEFQDVKPKTSATLSIATAQGIVSVDASQSQERRDGKDFLVLSGTVTLVMNSPGEFEAIPVTCRTKRGTDFRRQLLGSVRPSRSHPAIAAGKPLSFTVKPLPEEGRPASFAGAVGSGYSIDSSANRTVVRVGDPISLNVSLRGEGLEKMSLPDLSIEGGLTADRFQLPSERPVGNYDGKTKQFKVNVRVKDESVNQIPGLAFSWFDPKKAAYVTARSKPIALQVMPAQVLDADDVISSAKSAEESAAQAQEVVPSTRTLIARGANLAIERDVVTLMSKANGALSSSSFILGSYAFGVSAVLLAVFVRRRRDVDPAVVQRRQEIRAWRQQLVDASKLAGKEAAEQIASSLRKFVRIADDSARFELNALIARCEEAVYAPHENASTSDLAKLALQLVDRIKA